MLYIAVQIEQTIQPHPDFFAIYNFRVQYVYGQILLLIENIWIYMTKIMSF